MSHEDIQAVTVAIRVRPPPRQTGSASGRLCVGVAPRTNSVLVSRDDGALNAANSGAAHNSPSKKTFSFNKVHGVDASQEHVYALSCAGLVHQFVDGFNVTIFAYGQTSSGKTYTMGSTNHFDTSEHEMGIIPRVVHQVMNLISMKQKMDPNISFIIRCTFLEIYQEQVRDLLMPGNDAKDIAIREDRNGSVTVSGVHEETVHTAEDLFRCLERGGIERTTGDTKMHLHSSRSHAVFTLILEQRLDTSKLVGMETDEEAWGAGAPAQSHSSRLLRCSKLHLVDLAGSERVKRTGAEGVRLKESVKINSGLLALGNVISVLGEMHESSGGSIAANMHVPYRDSKLTRLLQNSLGGNAKTLMLACISPCDEDYEETLNTLKYADRARKIQNKPVINTIDHQAVKLASMQERIDFLESQIKKQTEVALNINPSELPSQRSRQDSSDISFAQAAFVDVENDKVLAYFVEELKNRTIRGTNAIRALQDANNENKRLMDRITDLEERLHKTRLASESITAQYEKCKLQVYDANAMHARLQTDFNIVFNTLENIVTLFASIPFNGNNVEHTVAWQRIQESMDDRKWQSFVAVCDLHRPTLIQEKFEVIESRFPAISGDALTSAALSKPSSRKSSAFGSRFQRRSLKVMPTPFTQLTANEEMDEDTAVKRLRNELEKSERDRLLLLKQAHDMNEEREIEAKIVLEKDVLIESLRSLNADMEAHFNATQAISIAKRSNTTQTDGSMIAAAAEPLIPRSPYQNLTTAELIEAIIAKNRETDFQVQQVHLPLIVESVGDVESIKLLSRVNDEQDVTVSAAELYPVHNAKNELEHEGEALSRNEEKNLTYSDDKGELLLDLQSTMKAKAELQRELAIRNKEMEKLKHQHGEKMSKLERELEASTRELNKAKTDLDESASQKERLKEEHDKRVKHLESQIIKAKTKIKEQERVIKEKEMSDRRASDMQQEVEKLQVALNNAKKKAKEDSEKLSELETRRIKDASALNRAREEDAKKIRQLEVAAEVVRKKLDRKNEELSVLSKKLKDGLAVNNVNKPGKTKAINVTDEILSVTVLEPSPEMQMLTQENERFRIYLTVSGKIRAVKCKIDAVTSRIHELERSGDEEQLREVKMERKALAKELVDLREQRKAIEAGLEEEGTFVAESLSTRPGTAIIDEINYAALYDEFHNNEEALAAVKRLKSATLYDSRAMVVACLRELSDLRALESNLDEEVTPKRHLANSECQTEETRQESGDWGNDLEYYKQSSKDLKMKLRELVALNHSLTQRLETGPDDMRVQRGDIAPAAL